MNTFTSKFKTSFCKTNDINTVEKPTIIITNYTVKPHYNYKVYDIIKGNSFRPKWYFIHYTNYNKVEMNRED